MHSHATVPKDGHDLRTHRHPLDKNWWQRHRDPNQGARLRQASVLHQSSELLFMGSS
jgi:hypothetical protein